MIQISLFGRLISLFWYCTGVFCELLLTCRLIETLSIYKEGKYIGDLMMEANKAGKTSTQDLTVGKFAISGFSSDVPGKNR